MTKNQQAIQRLENLLLQDLESLKDLSIFKLNNKFYIFDRYTIEPRQGRYYLQKFTDDEQIFHSLRAATSWCIADKFNQIALGMEIKRLDQKKGLLDADIRAREELNKKTSDPIRREIVAEKLCTKKLQLRSVSQHLDKCVNLAKYWQIRGFNNETARTGRSASNRTSR